jgi:hypothetical protein
MLEKYKKLAQDAQLNGDRVQAEYYHQFADHYFRVLADFRSRQEENRPQRNEWRNDDREGGEWRDEDRETETGEDEAVDTDNLNEDSEEGEERRPQQRNDRRDRNDRNDRNRNRRDRNDRYDRNDRPQQQRDEGEASDGGLDLAVLPPAIGAANDGEEAEAKPARKPRARKPKSAEDETVAAE